MPTLAPSTGPEEAGSPPLAVGQQLALGRQLARREEMGILGVSIQERLAFVSAEKKAQRSEMIAHRAREWIYTKGGGGFAEVRSAGQPDEGGEEPQTAASLGALRLEV